MDDRPRNLREMLAEAKDTSELMVDLAYAALYFGDPDMAEEVGELEERMSRLVQAMRAVCILAVRHPRDAEGMSSVLQVVSAIERIANDAVDIARIVTHRVGIPAELVADLSAAEEVSHRVLVSDGSMLAHRHLSDHEMPVQMGMRVMAVRREREWITDIGGDTVIVPDDVLFLRGSPEGIEELRKLAGSPGWSPPQMPDGPVATDLDRAVDVLVEMKDLSEVAVGLAYSALVLRDESLAAEVRHLEDRLDEMKDRLEMWVLRAARDNVEESGLRGLLHLSQAAEDIGDQAQQMVWIIERQEEIHPILAVALGDSDDVVVHVPVAAGSEVDGSTLGDLRLNIEPGFTVLAIRRGGQYRYRPRGEVQIKEGDALIASGPDEGRERLAEMCGWVLLHRDDEARMTLEPLSRLPDLSESGRASALRR